MVLLGSKPPDHSDQPGIRGQGEPSQETLATGMAVVRAHLDAILDDRAPLRGHRVAERGPGMAGEAKGTAHRPEEGTGASRDVPATGTEVAAPQPDSKHP